jgi:hypothetical protein
MTLYVVNLLIKMIGADIATSLVRRFVSRWKIAKLRKTLSLSSRREELDKTFRIRPSSSTSPGAM